MIQSHRFAYSAFCALGKSDGQRTAFQESVVVDELKHYTLAMWNVLTDIVLWEWFHIRLPRSMQFKTGGLGFLPADYRLLYHLDRQRARALKHDIDRRYSTVQWSRDRMSIFEGYGLSVADDRAREQEGMAFLARQAEHFAAWDDRIIIVGQPLPIGAEPAPHSHRPLSRRHPRLAPSALALPDERA